MKGGVAAILAMASFLPATALAREGDAAPLSLSVVRDDDLEACPDAESLRAQVAEYLKAEPMAAAVEGIVEVRFLRHGEKVQALVRMRSRAGVSQGSRVFAGDSCSEVRDAVALSIALQIDPDARARALLVPSEKQPARESTRASAVSRPPPSGLGFGLDVGVIGAAGLLPRTAAGVRALAWMELAPLWHLRSGARLFPEVRTADARFAFGLNAVDVGLCRSFVDTRWWNVHGCIGVSAGEIHAVPFTLEPTLPGARLWLGGDAEVGSFARVGPLLTVNVGAGATVPITRQAFVVGGEAAQVFQQPAAVPFARFGVGLSFSGRSTP